MEMFYERSAKYLNRKWGTRIKVFYAGEQFFIKMLATGEMWSHPKPPTFKLLHQFEQNVMSAFILPLDTLRDRAFKKVNIPEIPEVFDCIESLRRNISELKEIHAEGMEQLALCGEGI